jgi:hypothetical protein
VFLDIINQSDGTRWGAGAFFCPTIDDMISALETTANNRNQQQQQQQEQQCQPHKKVKLSNKNNNSNKKVLFEIIVRSPNDSPRYVDVAYQQVKYEKNTM